MVFRALSRSGASSAHSFDLKNASPFSVLSHSVIAIARNEIRGSGDDHGRTPSDRSVGAQLMNSTLVPLWTIFASACASQLVRWTQPCDWVLPMLCGLGVPWMP